MKSVSIACVFLCPLCGQELPLYGSDQVELYLDPGRRGERIRTGRMRRGMLAQGAFALRPEAPHARRS
eukprot:2466054-Pleurochrysis_carterae.AAC.2